MTAEPPAGSSTASVGSRVSRVLLDQGFSPLAFTPGRYAVVIKRFMQGTHAMQVLNEQSKSSFVLELAADGAATAYRGWRYDFRNDGPEVHTYDRYREQQGYRGRYTVADGVAEVTLTVDDTVCSHEFQGNLALVRAPRVKLRCLVARPISTSQLTEPVLLCQSSDTPPAEELDPYVVEQLAPSGWFVLGSGNGLRISVTGRPPGAYMGDDVEAKAQSADAPLSISAWDQPF